MLKGSTAAFQRRSVMVFLVRQNEEDDWLRPKTKTTNTTGGSSQNHHHARAKTKAAHDVIIVNKSNHAAYVSSVKHYDEQMDAPMFHSNVAHPFNHDALAPPVLSTSICYSIQMLRITCVIVNNNEQLDLEVDGIPRSCQVSPRSTF